MEYRAIIKGSDELTHYGVLGMKWGVRKAMNSIGNMAIASSYIKQYSDYKKYW